MMYDDFKIIPDEMFKKMNEEFSKSKLSNRKLTIDIFNLLNEVLNLCFCFPNQYNKKITNTIEHTKCEIEPMVENFSSIFKLEKSKEKSFYNFNIFALLKKINLIENKLYLYLKLEKDSYFCKFMEKNLFSLNKICFEFFSALEESNIKFFKYM